MAREKFEEMLAKAKLSKIDRELLRGDGLARLGDREGAEGGLSQGRRGIAKEDPTVQMRLANSSSAAAMPATRPRPRRCSAA